MATHVASGDERGCPLANAAVELPEKDHPARRVIEAFKTAQRERLVRLCAAAALAEPDMLADELFLLLEGARVAAQSMGTQGLGDRLLRMGHVWTVPAVQEESDYQRSVRVRSCIRPLLSLGGLPLSRCSRYGRWP
jgi:hypothetical protein